MATVSEFPSNSHRARAPRKTEEAEPKKIDPIVTGEVIKRKKPLGKRFAETFVGGDAKGVAGYVMFDVLIPAAKDMVADAMSQGVERMLFGEARSSARRGGYRPTAGYTAYNRMSSSPTTTAYRPDPRDTRAPAAPRARRANAVADVVIPSRHEADEVVDRLYDLLEKYDVVSVREYYEMVNVPFDHTDEKYGWTNLSGTRTTRLGNEGYLVELPRPEPID